MTDIAHIVFFLIEVIRYDMKMQEYCYVNAVHTPTNTHIHTQTHTHTRKHTQTHTHTNRHTPISADTHMHLLIFS